MNRLAWVVLIAANLAGFVLQAQNPLSSDVMAAYEAVKTNILKAAEKMPESEYNFQATAEERTFGKLIAHVADAQMGICGLAKGEPKRGDAGSKTSKAELIAALKASNDSCDAVYATMTDADGVAMVKVFGKERPKLGVLNMNVAHDDEMYGTMAVYLRLKGIVPPSTEAAAAKRP